MITCQILNTLSNEDMNDHLWEIVDQIYADMFFEEYNG